MFKAGAEFARDILVTAKRRGLMPPDLYAWLLGLRDTSALTVKLAQTTLLANAATVTFTGIPQTYSELLLIGADVRSTRAAPADDAYARMNNIATSTYSHSFHYNDGTTVAASQNLSDTKGFYLGSIPAASTAASHVGAIELVIPNYRTGGYKNALARSGRYNGTNEMRSDIYTQANQTVPITELNLRLGVGQFLVGTRFTLYGRG